MKRNPDELKRFGGGDDDEVETGSTQDTPGTDTPGSGAPTETAEEA